MEVSDPKVSVVIPSHNQAATLGRAVRSVLMQSPPPCEVVVLEDASTDGSPFVVRALAERHPNLRLHAYPEKSKDWLGDHMDYTAHLTGDYIHSLGADDCAFPELYAALLPGMRRGAGICLANVVVIDAHDRPQFAMPYKLPEGHHYQTSQLYQWLLDPEAMLSGTACLLSKEVMAWLRETGAVRLGPWLDSVGYVTACWRFGVYHVTDLGGAYTLNTESWGSLAAVKKEVRDRRGAEAFFSHPEVVRGVPPELLRAQRAKIPKSESDATITVAYRDDPTVP